MSQSVSQSFWHCQNLLIVTVSKSLWHTLWHQKYGSLDSFERPCGFRHVWLLNVTVSKHALVQWIIFCALIRHSYLTYKWEGHQPSPPLPILHSTTIQTHQLYLSNKFDSINPSYQGSLLRAQFDIFYLSGWNVRSYPDDNRGWLPRRWWEELARHISVVLGYQLEQRKGHKEWGFGHAWNNLRTLWQI